MNSYHNVFTIEYMHNVWKPSVSEPTEFTRGHVVIKLRWDWLKVSFFLHFLSFCSIIWFFNRDEEKGEADSILPISLTIIEIVLALLAIFLGIAAFAGFWMVRSSAEVAARSEAKQCVKDGLPSLLTRTAIADAIKKDPAIIPMIANEIGRNNREYDLSDADADAIASSVDEKEG